MDTRAVHGALEAAELVAFDVLEPALRSRGNITVQARTVYGDQTFVREIRTLVSAEPAGRLVIPSLAEALARITSLEERVAAMEAELRALGGKAE